MLRLAWTSSGSALLRQPSNFGSAFLRMSPCSPQQLFCFRAHHICWCRISQVCCSPIPVIVVAAVVVGDGGGVLGSLQQFFQTLVLVCLEIAVTIFKFDSSTQLFAFAQTLTLPQIQSALAFTSGSSDVVVLAGSLQPNASAGASSYLFVVGPDQLFELSQTLPATSSVATSVVSSFVFGWPTPAPFQLPFDALNVVLVFFRRKPDVRRFR
eukprot:m.570415 g.570415  ORF g.570415 m.570415 type:complete len:211 (+) comp57852_c0_seq19:804-1436(+)